MNEVNSDTQPILSQAQRSYRSWALVLLIVIVTGALRFRLLDIPLDRDEGGYAYTAQLILQGIPPFERAYDMKMPGLYYVYAIILTVFGQTTQGIHFGLLLINAATIVLMFVLGRRLLDTAAGVMAAGSYAIMSLSQHVEGFSANAEHLLVLPMLAGIILMLRAIATGRKRDFFLSGILLGLAMVIKHQGIFFVGFAGLYLFISYFKKPSSQWKRYVAEYAWFFLGAIIPFGLLCLMFLYHGLFDKFWFWLFEYILEYSTSSPLEVGLERLNRRLTKIISMSVFLWAMAGIGLSSLLWYKKARACRVFLGVFLFFSCWVICIGFWFYNHYFVLLLPVLALLAGAAFSAITEFSSRGNSLLITKGIPVLLFIAALAYPVLAEREYLFRLSPDEISRTKFGANPFLESVRIAQYIKKHSSPDDSIGVLGSEPQICFYSQRRSASAHLYVYPLMSKHRLARQMHEEMIGELEAARPKFLVFVNVLSSWLAKSGSEKLILEWSDDYARKYYQQVGITDIVSKDRTIYRWDTQAKGYKPRSRSWLKVYRRSDNDRGR